MAAITAKGVGAPPQVSLAMMAGLIALFVDRGARYRWDVSGKDSVEWKIQTK